MNVTPATSFLMSFSDFNGKIVRCAKNIKYEYETAFVSLSSRGHLGKLQLKMKTGAVFFSPMEMGIDKFVLMN
jgi:hypothetical protein